MDIDSGTSSSGVVYCEGYTTPPGWKRSRWAWLAADGARARGFKSGQRRLCRITEYERQSRWSGCTLTSWALLQRGCQQRDYQSSCSYRRRTGCCMAFPRSCPRKSEENPGNVCHRLRTAETYAGVAVSGTGQSPVCTGCGPSPRKPCPPCLRCPGGKGGGRSATRGTMSAN